MILNMTMVSLKTNAFETKYESQAMDDSLTIVKDGKMRELTMISQIFLINVQGSIICKGKKGRSDKKSKYCTLCTVHALL